MGDGWPDIDPTGFFLVRPPVIMPLKRKGTAGSQRGRVTFLEVAKWGPSLYCYLPFPPHAKSKNDGILRLRALDLSYPLCFIVEEPPPWGFLTYLI